MPQNRWPAPKDPWAGPRCVAFVLRSIDYVESTSLWVLQYAMRLVKHQLPSSVFQSRSVRPSFLWLSLCGSLGLWVGEWVMRESVRGGSRQSMDVMGGCGE